MLIKVCGMRDAENIRQTEALGVDYMGFIFWPHSRRYVAERPVYLPSKAKRVGVFVNSVMDDIIRHIDNYGLDVVQLHGHESPEYIQSLKILRENISIIKAFNIATPDDLVQTVAYEGLADYFLFDTKGKAVGGNGEKFDWSVLTAYDGSTPFLLSGGIGPDDANSILSFHHDRCLGIDLNSRFEISPGLKDINNLKFFLSVVREKDFRPLTSTTIKIFNHE